MRRRPLGPGGRRACGTSPRSESPPFPLTPLRRHRAAVLLLNVRPCPGIESWVSFDMSHARNSSSLAAVSSYETVVDAPHARHLHLWDPAPVLPFLFIAAPQEGHLTAFISSSLEIGNLTA